MAHVCIRSVFAGTVLAAMSLFWGMQDAHAARRALIIGNAQYENASPLANPENDATDLAARLSEIGYEVHGGGAQLNLRRRDMAAAVRDFTNSLDEGDIAIYYYAGHGVAHNGTNYLIPVDDGGIEFSDDLPDYGYAASSILQRLAGRQGVTGVVILDACRNNPLPAREGSRSSGRGLSDMETPPGVSAFILYSAAKGQVASDGDGRNSPFTAALLGALETPAREIDDIIYDISYSMRLQSEGRQVPWAEFAFAGRSVPTLIDLPAEGDTAGDDVGTVSSSAPVAVATDISETVWSGISALEDASARYGAMVGFVAQFPDSAHVPEAQTFIAEFEATATRHVIAQRSLENDQPADNAPQLNEDGKEEETADQTTADAAATADSSAADADELGAAEQLSSANVEILPVTRGPIEEQGAPFYETIELITDFRPDPQVYYLEAGGFEDASYLGDGCVGYVASQADFVIDYQAGNFPFYISAASDEDTVLVVRDPGGAWHCSDDFLGAHPAVGFDNPQSGAYRVWVGTFERSGNFPDTKLILSEIEPLY